jgi:flagellar motor switch protein FliN/FliY
MPDDETPQVDEDTPQVDEDTPQLDELEADAESEMGSGVDPRIAEMDAPQGARDLEAVYQIPVQVSAILGKSTMQVSHLLKLGRGAVVELDRKVGEAIDIYVNNRLVARGEVVVVEDKLGVTMTEIIKTDRNS